MPVDGFPPSPQNGEETYHQQKVSLHLDTKSERSLYDRDSLKGKFAEANISRAICSGFVYEITTHVVF